MSSPKCPHCKYEFDFEDIWHTGSTDFPTQSDGDETDTTCSNCKEPLKIRLNLSPSWDFLDEDGEDL